MRKVGQWSVHFGSAIYQMVLQIVEVVTDSDAIGQKLKKKKEKDKNVGHFLVGLAVRGAMYDVTTLDTKCSLGRDTI